MPLLSVIEAVKSVTILSEHLQGLTLNPKVSVQERPSSLGH